MYNIRLECYRELRCVDGVVTIGTLSDNLGFVERNRRSSFVYNSVRTVSDSDLSG